MLHPRLLVAESLLEPMRQDRVLSVGAKRCELERRLAPRVASIDAIDVEPYVSEGNLPANVRYTVADVTRGLPFPDHTFDKVLYLEVMEHLPRGTEVLALREIRRVLRPGGMLVMSTPNWHVLACASDPAYWLRDHRHYRKKHVVAMLGTNGFHVDRTLKHGGAAEAVWVPSFYLASRVGLGATAAQWMHRAIAPEYRRLGWYTLFVRATVTE